MNVYFIQSGFSGPIKIGVAKNVQRRLEALQTGNSQELRIITTICCENRVQAYAIENRLHRQHREYHIRGEWFHPIILNNTKEKAEEKADLRIIYSNGRTV